MTFSEALRVARKKHRCQICWWSILPTEPYVRTAVSDGGIVDVTKECLWCYRTVRHWFEDNHWPEYWDEPSFFDWLSDQHKSTYLTLLAGWRYPDGERVPLPFQPSCRFCNKPLTKGELFTPNGQSYTRCNVCTSP